jgi:hypothetical protein
MVRHDTITVLTRGPVHEALAEQFDRTLTPGLLITEQPPGRLRELPPEHQPEGTGIVWIPGYWAWDDEVGEQMPAEEREQEKPEPETPSEGPAPEEDESAPEQPGPEQPQPQPE